QAGGEDGVAVGHPLDRVDQVGARDRLRHVAAGPGPDDGDDVLGGVGHRQGEEADVGTGAGYRLDDLLAPAAREVGVEQYDVGIGVKDADDGAVDVVGRSDHLHLVAQLGPHAGQ